MKPVSLSQLKRGQSGVVCSTSLAADDAAMLGAMGLRCNAKVRLCREGEPCIVAICSGASGGASGVGSGCRIGLARPLADRIMVEPTG